MSVELDLDWVRKFLDKPEYQHLKCEKRGGNISVFSMDDYGRWNRCRFAQISRSRYSLDMSNRSGKWDPTFIEGTAKELMEMVAEQFPWILSE